MSDQIKITRTLYVGLGGTGVRAILRAKQCFMDSYGEVPPMVAFLAVDTDKAIRNKSLKSRSGKDVRLSDNEVCFCGITGSALDIYRHHIAQFQWVPRRNVAFLANLKNTGAGQIRSNGRFLVRHNADNISRLVASKVTAIGRPLPVGSRFVYDTNKDGVEYPVIVNVVGSVAGGTGSGTFLDMLVLIAKTLRDSGLSYAIKPWMVLPDVFRHMAPGPLSENVLQNAYGAIRELDYLYHLPKDNQNVIDFHFDKVYYLDEGIGDTYLFNNTNKAGVVFQNVDDIADSIGRCMFLPSNEVDSVKDNADNVDFIYSIRNKESHYVSAGSAEIVYDNQAVGNVIARGIISDICTQLVCSSSVEAINKEVNAWTTSEAVAIQEHDADLLTDSILAKYAPFSIIVDRDTDENVVNANIVAGAEAENVINEVRTNVAKKLENVKIELVEKLKQILNSQNGVGAAKDFLESLSDSVSECKGEMNEEAEKLQQVLAYPIDWNAELSALDGPWWKPWDKDAAEALQSRISDYVAQKRDLLRHKWAIQFFTNFGVYVNQLLAKINVLKVNLETVARKQKREIMAIQQLAKSSSHFQVYLHSDDVDNFNLPNVSETSALFRSENSIYGLIDKSAEELGDLFFDFAKEQQSVRTAVNVTVEDKMNQMTDTELRVLFAKAKEMSSPLWVTNTHGYLDHAQELTTVFTIGVFDQSKGLIQTKYKDEFTLGSIEPTFATTHDTDRITFFQSQCYSPAYAVNNMRGYLKDAEAKFKQERYPVCYIDEKWNERMLVEGFDIMPKQEKDKVLPMWVNAIIYGFVKYDEALESYCIKSKQGRAIKGGIVELGKRRDLAFDQFQLKGLDKEVEERIQNMVSDKGRPAVDAIIKDFKNNIEDYLSRAQLSAIEYDRVLADDPAYSMVIAKLEEEIKFLEELD